MEIYKKLAEINKGVTAIGKNNTNKQQGFSYRGVDDVMNELHALFAQHEVIILPEIMNAQREERPSKSGGVLMTSICDYKFSFATTDGSCCSCIVRGEAMDSGDKSSNKSIAIALKYALTQMFLIPTNEPKDPDAESHEPKPKPESFKASEHCISTELNLSLATTIEELDAVAGKIKEDKTLSAKEKEYLRTVYNKQKGKLK